jgi:preprotein translocase subunit Sss1
MKILELAGLGKFKGSAYREAQANVGQMPRFLKLNEIEIAAREAFNVLWCVRARELRSLNRASRRPTRKAYDSIAVITGAPNSSAQIYLGIQYERTIKSKARYAQIRKNLEAERQIHGLLYFVDSEKAAAFISREVYSATVPVGVVIASQFQSDGADATLRVLDGLSVVRAMAGLIAHPLCDLLSEFDQTNAPIADS